MSGYRLEGSLGLGEIINCAVGVDGAADSF